MRKVCLNMVHELAKRDPRVVYIGSDPGPGTLDKMRQEFPDRFFIEGISEAHVIGLAAGLAMDGYIPYVNTIATFLTRRCYEQVAIDLCLHNLPVRLIGNGGGFVYAPLGPTHTAVEDVAIMRALPNMGVVAPADAEEMRRFMDRTLDWAGPLYIRLGKGGDPVVTKPEDGFDIGQAIIHRAPQKVTIISTGVMIGRAQAAADLLAQRGIACGVVHMPTIKPLDETTVCSVATAADLVVTLEEHTRIGGLGSAVLECLADSEQAMPRVLRLGLPDSFTHHYGSQDGLLKRFGLDPQSVADTVTQAVTSARAAE